MSKLLKRYQRKLYGGTVYLRLYEDGRVRVRTDHPSNDAATELMMAAAVIGSLGDVMRSHGIEPQLGPITWRSDPG